MRRLLALTFHSYRFRYATVFTGTGVGGWNVGNVNSMFFIFANINNFHQNLASWNVVSVTNMRGMVSFRRC